MNNSSVIDQLYILNNSPYNIGCCPPYNEGSIETKVIIVGVILFILITMLILITTKNRMGKHGDKKIHSS